MRPMKHVVVVIPGIMGSVLTKDGREIWSTRPATMLGSLLRLGRTLDDLTLRRDSEDAEDVGDGVEAAGLVQDLHLIPGFWKIDGYTALTRRLRETYDLVPGANYLEFGYDWRRDNRSAAHRLKRACDALLATRRKTHADAQLVFVTHSMGGLVARYFLECLDGAKDCAALLTFCTPHRGSMNALETLSLGARKAAGLVDLTDMARSFTSIYQLLPVYPSLDRGDGKPVIVGEVDGIPNVDAKSAAKALRFHEDIREASVKRRAADAEDGYRTFVVVGSDQPTSQSALLKAGVLTMQRSIEGEDIAGDGTVPFNSAVPRELREVLQPTYIAGIHGSVQNMDAALDHVVGMLRGLTLPRAARDLGVPSARRIPLALEATDLAWTDETTRVAISASDPIDDVVLVLETPDGERPVAATRVDERSWAADIAPLAEGTYRLNASAKDASPVRDAFVVCARA